MMFKLSFNNETVEVDTAQVVSPLSPEMISLLSACRILNGGIALSVLRFMRQTGIQYQYTFTAKDGRVWSQSIKVPPGAPNLAGMTFDVPDFWTLAEFALQRPVRAQLIELVGTAGLVSLIYTWS